MVGVVVAVIVAIFLGPISAAGFALGAILSGVTGFIGMNISVRANVRTAEAARTSLQGGLTLAFRSGAVTGKIGTPSRRARACQYVWLSGVPVSLQKKNT